MRLRAGDRAEQNASDERDCALTVGPIAAQSPCQCALSSSVLSLPIAFVCSWSSLAVTGPVLTLDL